MDDGSRPLRADAQRNRDRLVEVATAVFAQDGTDVALETVARSAGVGIGTLYRHFPTREALVEAVYRAELGRVCDAATTLLDTEPPDRALRSWLEQFVVYMTAKQGMADALKAVIASGGDPFAESRRRLVSATTSLMSAGVAAGTLRADVDPEDVVLAAGGIALATGDVGLPERTGRLVDLLMAGLRPGATPS